MHPGPSDFTYLWGPLLTMFAVMAVAPFLMRVIKKVRKWLESDEGSSSDAKSAQEPSWSVSTGNRDARLNADGYVGLPASANDEPS